MIIKKSKNKVKAKRAGSGQAASGQSSSQYPIGISSNSNNNNNRDHYTPPTKAGGQIQYDSSQLDGFNESASMSNDNDEENIVIDLADEDEDDDDNEGEIHNAQAVNGFFHHDNDHSQSGNEKLQAEQGTARNGNSSDSGPDAGKRLQFKVGDLIWFDPNQLGYSIPGKVIEFYPELMVLSIEGCGQPLALADGLCQQQQPHADPLQDELERNKSIVKADEQLQIYELSDTQLFKLIKPRQPISAENGHQDLVDLSDVSLESVIWNLKLRFKRDLIYTQCGRKILFSVNPHKQLSELYDLKQVSKYDTVSGKLTSKLVAEIASLAEQPYQQAPMARCHSARFIRWLSLNVENNPKLSRTSHTKGNDENADEEDESRRLINKLPHLFSLANDALKSMLTTGQDQCFLLLGDSGSGKTETCKLLLQYFATINKSPTNLMTELILESIQMLESFGNAKTVLNDNSSRFGKLIEINFNLVNGFILDARLIDLNLLDRGRIVCQSEGERNFHVFYELLSGLSASEKEKYGLQMAKNYFYLNQGHCAYMDGTNSTGVKDDDAEDFRSLCASMQVLGFNYEEQDTIFRILASILHLGNIYFHRKVLAVRSGKLAVSGGDEPSAAGIEGVEVGSDTELRWVSHLLQIQFDHVLRCLTVRTSETPGVYQLADCIVTPLNIDQALDTRDAIARALYSCLFRWLVQRINAAINGASNEPQQQPTEESGAKDEPIYLCRTSESLCEFQPDKLHNHTSGNIQQLSSQQQQATVLVLDAFGFENLAENQFEQLCINYSAELLHHHVQRYLVRLEQAEYARERLKWRTLNNTDQWPSSAAHFEAQLYGLINSSSDNAKSNGSHNQLASSASSSIVNLISKKPLGILALLDDECNFPKATDQSFAEKCHHNHALNDNYQCARLASSASHEFGVRHFGQQSRMIWYQVDGFVERNRDSLRPDVLELLLGSRMTLIVDMLQKMHLKPASNGDRSTSNSASGTLNSSTGKTLSRTYDGRYVAMKPRATTAAARYLDTLHNNRVLESIGAAQRQEHHSELQSRQSSIRSLATAAPAAATRGLLQATPNPWFIVCLKPNRGRASHVFDVPYVQEQVRAFALIDLVRQRKFGYPVRMRFVEFLKRYKCLVNGKFLTNFNLVDVIARSQVKSPDKQTMKQLKEICCSIIEFQFHSQRLAQELLRKAKSNSEPHQYQCGLTKIFLNERLFHQLEYWRTEAYASAIVLIQKIWRMWSIRREFLYLKSATICIQANWRCFALRRQYLNQLVAIISVQRHWRRVLSQRRRLMIEARRRELKQRQQEQMQQLQAEQSTQTNQFRFRLHPSQIMRAQQQMAAPSQIYAQRNALLDIPEDLAQLYRLQKQTNWLPVHQLTNLNQVNLNEMFERERLRLKHINKFDKTVPFVVAQGLQGGKDDVKRWQQVTAMLDQLELDKRFSLRKLLLKYFPPEVPHIGYSRLPIIRPFTYTKIKRSRRKALRQNKRRNKLLGNMIDQNEQEIRRRFLALEQKALAIYKLILRFIDSDQILVQSDESGSNILDQIKADEVQHERALQKLLKFKLISDYISYLCLTEPLLRDEVFLQLISQTWQNKCQRSVGNTWKLLLNCLCCFDPLDIGLGQLMLIYAHDYCCETYRKQVCLKLFEAIERVQSSSAKLSKWSLGGNVDEYRLVEAISIQRKLPATMLEYWAQQVASKRTALAVSCYVDDYSLCGSMSTPRRNNEADERAQIANLALNYSNKTLVCLDARSSAEQLARKLLVERQIPEANQFGWSLEIQHEGELSEFSSRLRGDDLVLDHFARFELLPELVQLVDDDLDTFESEHVADEIGLLADLARAVDNSADGQQVGVDPLAQMPSADSCLACNPEAAQTFDPMQMSNEQQNHRLSLLSHASWDQSMATRGRHSASNSDAGTMRSRRVGGPPMQPRWSRNMDRSDRLAYDDNTQQVDPRRGANRRSMSMQELQLASSSVLNERYFGAHATQHCDEYGCYQLQQQQPPRKTSRRTSSGSLRQLNQPAYISFGQQHQRQQHEFFAAQQQAHASQQTGHRRSSTPNSIGGTRHSSSAYGSQSSRNVAGSMASSGDRPSAGASALKQRPRRLSTSGTNNNQRPMARTVAGSDYASTQSDYERIVPADSSRRQQQRLHRRLDDQPQQQQQQLHYVASSAMSDTSEAPSLASHVRRVEAPRTNGDLDRYLDDLFNPLLDGCKDLDEMSDVRSLAPSIRAEASDEAFLARMGDAKQLSRMIRGLDADDKDRNVDDDGQQPGSGVDEEEGDAHLSPTFESLIKSLRAQQQQVVAELGELESSQQITGDELSAMNLSELKALNEQLEGQIRAAKSARNSMQIEQLPFAAAEPPVPPPQPNFVTAGALEMDTSAPADNKYSRAKTIRIGKWRWPPAREDAGQAADDEAPTGGERKRASVLSCDSYDATNSTGSQDKDSKQAAEPSNSSMDFSVGRLKISGEMKAKLEQLTNSSSANDKKWPPTDDEQTLCEDRVDNQRPGRLAEQRRNLLETQLLGAHSQSNSAETNEQYLGKVLAAKQQLAAAAGLALSALDSSSTSSQASSRRQSGQIAHHVGTSQVTRHNELKAEELGPKSRAAIEQRRLFYCNSTSPCEPEPAGSQPKTTGADDRANGQLGAASRANAAKFLSLAKQQQLAASDKQLPRESEWIASSCSPDLNCRRALAECKPLGTSTPTAAKLRANIEPPRSAAAVGELAEKQSMEPLDCLVYANVNWQARVRKELFRPSEGYDKPLMCQMIFAQLVADVFNPRHWTRLNNKERAALKSIMKDNSIGYSPGLPPIGQMEPVKRELVRMARSFGLYFTRPYQALNFACLSENLPWACDDDSGDDVSSTATSRASSDDESDDARRSDSLSSGDNGAQQRAVARGRSLAFRLAHRLRTNNNLATDWVDMVAVHHSGLRLVTLVSNGADEAVEHCGTNWTSRHSGASWCSANRQLNVRGSARVDEATPAPGVAPAQPAGLGYKVLETLKFRDMTDVALVGARVLLVSMRNGKKCWMLSSNQANQLALLLKSFHGDYNNERQTGVKERHRTAPAISNEAAKQQQQLRSRHDKHQRRQDALLAGDDGHDGDNFEQRQAANCVSKQRSSHDSDNVLAEPERILPNNLATDRAALEQSSKPSRRHGKSSGKHSSACGAGRLQPLPATAAPLPAPAPPSSSASKPSTHSGVSAASADPAPDRSRRAERPPAGGDGGSRGTSSGREHDDGGARSGSGRRGHSDQSAPTIDTAAPGDKQRQQLVRGTKRASSLWQNSLSRMSSKFNLFAGATSGAARKQQLSSAQQKRQLVDETTSEIATTTSANQQNEAALDAWIETKVDFDDDENDDDETDKRSSMAPSASSNGGLEQAHDSEQASAERAKLISSMPKENDDQKRADDASVTVNKTSGAKLKDEDGKYSMLQFALYNFREALDKYSTLLQHGQHQQAGDTSTLRGSLKLIESLRNSRVQTPSGQISAHGTLRSIASSSLATDEWTWRELAEMVKFTRLPLKRSLLRLPQTSDDLERRALECFSAIMQYMGDLEQSTAGSGHHRRAPPSVPVSEVECVYLILINCHNYPLLRDEVYCQLMKQTTNNRQQPGSQVDSCLRGWRLFSIVAAYFDCSPKLRPYLVKYLEQAAYDKRRAYHSVAMLCLQNLRKTFKYKGRKNVPSIEEIAATSAGRNSKRQIYRLPGGTERVINTKSTTVVHDIIQEICVQMLGVTSQSEMLEFSLYCIADGDLYTMPLNRDEYILDITTELVKNHQQYFLIFCRSIWYFPLRLDNKLYIEVTFNQIAPDYLEGLLLVLPANIEPDRKQQKQLSAAGATATGSQTRPKLTSKLVREMARIAALLHRASGTDYMPHKDEIKYLLPKPIVAAIKRQQKQKGGAVSGAPLCSLSSSSSSSSCSAASSSSSINGSSGAQKATGNVDANLYGSAPGAEQWIELVQGYWREMSAFNTLDAKAQFLDIVRHWPLFGSSFFAVKLIQRDLIQPLEFILALNKLGVQMLDTATHETVHRYPFSEVVSTRKVRSEDGALFLDMKCGNLMKRTIIRIQTDQAHEISRLIRQYIDIELLQANSGEAAATFAPGADPQQQQPQQ